MAKHKRNKIYDAYILQEFQFGRTPREIYRELQKRAAEIDVKYIMGIATLYRMYGKWVEDGKPGELEQYDTAKVGDSVLVAYRLKNGA